MRSNPSAKSNCVSTRSRERIVWLTSTAWISRPTNYVPWFENGKRSLKLTLTSKPLTVTLSGSSPSASQSDVHHKSERPPTPNQVRFGRSGKRCSRLWHGRRRPATWRNSFKSSFLKPLDVRLRRHHVAFTLCKTFTWERRKSWRLLNSTSQNYWNFMASQQMWVFVCLYRDWFV